MERKDAIAAALRRVWNGLEAGLLAPSFDRPSRALAAQLEWAGATLKVLVLGSAPQWQAHEVPPFWTAQAAPAPVMDRMAFEALLRSPPASLAAWLDDVDPLRELTLLGGVYTEVPELCGRRIYGWRRPDWGIWEDKTRIDAFFDRCGVPTPAHIIAEAADPALPDYVYRLDSGLGVIVAMDAMDGYSGDAKGLRWIRNKDELSLCVAEFRGRTQRLRIATYVEGVPASILGMVTADGVAVFDPLEIITLRDRSTGQLRFCGTSNRWRPRAEEATAMRAATRLAGAELSRRADYAGFFSLDGIAASGGFVATEVNPRHASGLGLQSAWPWFPDYLFHRAVQERETDLWTVPSAWLEETFRSAIAGAPSHRIAVPRNSGGAHRTLKASVTAGQANYTVSYEVDGGSATLLDVEPMPGLLGPVAAALARRLGPNAWQSPAEAAAEFACP